MDNINGPIYAFWSGIGSDIGEITILGFVINWYRKHKEHMKFHRKHMEIMNEWLGQSLREKTSVSPVPDIDE